MNLFVNSIITPPAHLPVTASDTDLAAAVVEEIERVHLWRGIVRQTRRITLDGPLPPRIEIEPVASLTSLTRWTPTDDAAVIDATNYHYVTREPGGTILEPLPWYSWPSPERSIGSFSLTYTAGWMVTPESSPGAGDAVNLGARHPIRLMIERAIAFRAVELASPVSPSARSRLVRRRSPTRTDQNPPRRLPASDAAFSTDRALISSQTVDDARRCTHCEN